MHHTYLSRIKTLVLVVYIFVLPFLEAPQWCIRKAKAEPGWSRSGSIYCGDLGVPYSGNPTLSPVTIALVEFVCLGFIGFFRWSKTKWSVVRISDWRYNIVFAVSFSIIIIDNIVAIALFKRPFLSNLMRPVVFGFFLHLVRVSARQFVNDIRDSVTLLVAIFAFIGFYSLVGVYLFRYTFEGYWYFAAFDEALYNMIILMTTANFPDVMLPAYTVNYWNMLFFVSYLIIGLYFMMSFLLANVFNKFKERLE